MGLFDAMDVSASGLTAERLRMDTIAANLANANTTRGADGVAYRRREVVTSEVAGGGAATGAGRSFASFGAAAGALGAPGGVEVVEISEDPTPGRTVYDPGHPDADGRGYVQMPNVNPVTEMVDLITATRSYEASTTALNAIKQEFTRALDVLR
jgi:flagellar basal-body rod protein FlgC